jgi:hypothetical protein
MKRFVALTMLIITMSLLSLTAWQLIVRPDQDNGLPLYPGAEDVTRTGTRDVPQSVSFTSADSPTAIEQFYIKALTAQGWRYNNCGFFERYVNDLPRNASLTTSTETASGGTTHTKLDTSYRVTSCETTMP